jgi:hypothetical protein
LPAFAVLLGSPDNEQEANMRVLTAAVAALALMGSCSAYAQVYVTEPAPAPYYYAPGPVIVAPAPSAVYVGPGYGDAYAPGPYSDNVVVNARTGRWCRIEPDGYRWCWTP